MTEARTDPVLPYAFAKRHGVVLIEMGERARLGLRQGGDPLALAEARRVLGRPVSVEPLAQAEFDRRLSEAYVDHGMASSAEDFDLPSDLDTLAHELPAAADLLDTTDDAPVIRLINGLIAEAARTGASDIHIEPYESALVVRMRRDGVLREALRLPARITPMLVSRVKVASRNILTIEDPVEYAMEGVGQTQVNTKVGMTFASGLRAILRQDPDVVMVGEIRDVETAQIAVQASLTGHLVLSTVHTNDAAGAITRLRDMGVEPFLLASTRRLIMAQRLVRKLCPRCRRPEPADAATAASAGLEPGAMVWRPVGCDACGQQGYVGRIGVYEAIRVDDAVRRLIVADADESEIAAAGFRRSTSFVQRAREMVLTGVTSLEEAVRVIRQDAPAPAREGADHGGV